VRVGAAAWRQSVQVAEFLFQRPGAKQHMPCVAEPVKEQLLGVWSYPGLVDLACGEARPVRRTIYLVGKLP
jgi:hypothetical protein